MAALAADGIVYYSTLVAVLMHGVEIGKEIGCDKAAYGKISGVFFEQVAKSRRQRVGCRYSWEAGGIRYSWEAAGTRGRQQVLVGGSRFSWKAPQLNQDAKKEPAAVCGKVAIMHGKRGADLRGRVKKSGR